MEAQQEPEITLYRFVPPKPTIFDPVQAPLSPGTHSPVSIREQVGACL
jgi:hypothetical protein